MHGGQPLFDGVKRSRQRGVCDVALIDGELPRVFGRETLSQFGIVFTDGKGEEVAGGLCRHGGGTQQRGRVALDSRGFERHASHGGHPRQLGLSIEQTRRVEGRRVVDLLEFEGEVLPLDEHLRRRLIEGGSP